MGTLQNSLSQSSQSLLLVYTDILGQKDTQKGEDTSSPTDALSNNPSIAQHTAAPSLYAIDNNHNRDDTRMDGDLDTTVTQKRGIGRIGFAPSGISGKVPQKENPLFRPGCPRRKRKSITGYSRESQTRFMQFLMSLDLLPYLADGPNYSSGRAFFITLTYHYSVENKVSCDHFDAFCKGVMRRPRKGEGHMRVLWMVWKKEPQERGVVHYHLLVGYDIVQEKTAVQEWFQTRWDRAVKSHNRVHTVVAYANSSGSGGDRNANSLIFYLCKDFDETSNEPIPDEDDSDETDGKGKSNGTGRVWGNRGALPKKKPLWIALESEEERAEIFAWIRANCGENSSYLRQLSNKRHGFSVPSNGEELLKRLCQALPWLNDRVNGGASASDNHSKNSSYTQKRPLPPKRDPFDFYKAFPDKRCDWKQLADKTRPLLSKRGLWQIQAGLYLLEANTQMGEIVWKQWVTAEFVGLLETIEPAIQSVEAYRDGRYLEMAVEPWFPDETTVAIEQIDSSQGEVDYPDEDNNVCKGDGEIDRPVATPNETVVSQPETTVRSRKPHSNKREVVAKLLADEEVWQWSNRAIALRCGVSHTLVGNIKRQLLLEGGKIYSENSDLRKYVTRHGTVAMMNVRGINQGRHKGDKPSHLPKSPANDGREVWPAALQKGVEEGTIDRVVAETVAAELVNTHTKIKELACRHLITNTGLIRFLNRLCRHRPATFADISQRGVIPLANGAVTLAQATVHDLWAYLAEIPKERRYG